MLIRNYLLSFISCLFFVQFAQAQKINFSHITYSNGLSNNRILSFAEDNNGFIWIGTTSGLNRYDGYSIKTYTHQTNDSLSLPDNLIQDIVKDQLGQLWITTPKGLVIFNPENEVFSVNQSLMFGEINIHLQDYVSVLPMGDSLLLFFAPGIGIVEHNIFTNRNVLFIPKIGGKAINTTEITNIQVKGHKLYLVYSNGTVDIINYRKKTVVDRCDLISKLAPKVRYSYDVFIDNEENLWVYGASDNKGLYVIDTDKNLRIYNTDSKPALNSNLISDIVQDKDGNIWIGTDHGGVNLLNPATGQIVHVLNDEINPNSLSQNVITRIFKSSSNIIWVGTYKEGVNYYHKNMFKFMHFKHNADQKGSLPYDDVNCYAEDENGNIYIGTNGGGLIFYDRTRDVYKEVLSEELTSNVIVSLCYDKEGTLWIGTYYGGLLRYDGKTIRNYLHDGNDPETISDDRIWDIFEDSEGNIWIGTLGGGVDLFDKQREIFVHFGGNNTNSIGSEFVMDITEDSLGNLWFGTDFGVFQLEKQSSRFINYISNSNNSNSLSNNIVGKVFVDSRNNLWFGTQDGLNLYNSKTNTFKIFTTENGLPNDAIMGILESDQDDIWVSTLGGLSKISIEYDDKGAYLNHYTTNYNESDGLQGREFNEGSALKTRGGELIFGGSNGFNVFFPELSRIDSVNINVLIHSVKLFGEETNRKTIRFKNKSESAILNNNEMHLNYKQNIFSLEYVAINYINSDKVQYRYKLEGLNDQWIYTNWSDRRATFTNLNAGKYTFIVQASYPNVGWEHSQSILDIVVHPPWYRTWWAYILYYVILVGVFILARKNLIDHERIKYQKDEAEKESERQQELNLLKTRFFTNVSHEFRTPLTLILTPLEKLLKNDLKDDTRKHLELMNQNAKRLLSLVNQLLDFRKAEEDKLSLNLIYGNIIGFIDSIVSSFTDYRETKGIKLEFFPEEQELFMQFDKDKIEKIIMNLLSNAFKFTPEGGNIKVFVETTTKKGIELLKIKVEDTGIGISEEEQKRVFERFYQSELPDNFITRGSGIGLSLTSDFVELHGGTITVKSSEGKGSKFIVKIPINRTSSLELESDEVLAKEVLDIAPTEEKVATGDNGHTILIVEDNADFRFYLEDSLKSKYTIIQAENGKQAVDIIANDNVNLVVSDVMMPEMDGFELCDFIKSNPDYSHIPVILLTAKSTQKDKLEGLKFGADDYITKPFNFDILEARIIYLLGLRKKFVEEYQQSFKVKVDDKRVTPIDKKLLDKAMDLINNNISNSEFSVEGMSKELGMSRVYLYKKLSALTGKTPIELIRLVRLKKAAELLVQGELNVSEITYEVGFSDPKYFSKMFKAEFGQLPSKYKESQK